MTDDRCTLTKPDATRSSERAHRPQERDRMNEGCLSELRTMFSSGFTGNITLHVEKGCVKRVDQNRTWRPRKSRVLERRE